MTLRPLGNNNFKGGGGATEVGRSPAALKYVNFAL
jgi:hypothetical protein